MAPQIKEQEIRDGLALTEDEKRAKDFMYLLLTRANQVECDTDSAEIELKLPSWYDDAKFKRGQEYFKQNRFGILTSNLFGLLSVIAEPKGLRILASTGRSSTTETARKRYVQTMFHMISWYESELVPGSKSWQSLEQVRKMHFFASKQAKAKGLGQISQTEVALTAYGFMGFALTRPHTMGIKYDNPTDQEAFVFFWAVICAMLGVHDEFNMCLHPLKVVYHICEICRRYVYLQILQLETPLFYQMARAFYEGQKPFLPLTSFEALIFLNKRTAGLPGYQFNVDSEKEKICKPVFTDAEIQEIHKNYSSHEGYEYMRDFIVDGKIRMLNIRRRDSNNNNSSERYVKVEEEDKNLTLLHKVLELKHEEDLDVVIIEDKAWNSHLGDAEFHKLSTKDQLLVKMRCRAFENNYKWWGHWLHDKLVDRILGQMKKYMSDI